MPETLDKPKNIELINSAKSDFLQAKERLLRVYAETPEDKLNWSPSPTSRTPNQVVTHAASAIEGIHKMLTGTPFPVADTAAADKQFRAFEKDFTTRQQVLDLLEKTSGAYVAWLDGLKPEDIDVVIQFPFGFGEGTVASALVFPAAHTNGHTAQLDYIQTIYGDLAWH